MADAIAFGIYEAGPVNAGQPVTGAVCVVSAWNARTQIARTPPPVVEIGSGVYELLPSDADELEGVAVLVDTGAGHEPRYLLFEVSSVASQFLKWLHVDESTGALWSGALPTFTEWSGPGAAPTIASLGPGVFVAVPSAADIEADASGQVTAPTGAIPAFIAVSVTGAEVAPAPEPEQSTWEAALVQEIGLITGLPYNGTGARIRFRFQNARPEGGTEDLIRLSATNFRRLAPATPRETQRPHPTPTPGADLLLGLTHTIEFDFSIGYFARALSGSRSAYARLNNLIDRLQLDGPTGRLRLAGLVLVEAQQVLSLPAILETEYESRATVALRLRASTSVEEAGTYIEDATLTFNEIT